MSDLTTFLERTRETYRASIDSYTYSATRDAEGQQITNYEEILLLRLQQLPVVREEIETRSQTKDVTELKEDLQVAESGIIDYYACLKLIFGGSLQREEECDAVQQLIESRRTPEPTRDEALTKSPLSDLVQIADFYNIMYDDRTSAQQIPRPEFIVEGESLREIRFSVQSTVNYRVRQLNLLYHIDKYAKEIDSGFKIYTNGEGCRGPEIELTEINKESSQQTITKVVFEGKYDSTKLTVDESSFDGHGFTHDVYNSFSQPDTSVTIMNSLVSELDLE